MKWQEIRLHEGYLRAEGSGYTISSSYIRSFGIVIRMSVRPEHSELKSLGHPQAGLKISSISADKMFIPSVDADKMLCGIVPGDPSLVGRDYHTVGPVAKPRPEWMFNAIQTHGDVQMFCKDQHTRILVNDALNCLCPWMPSRRSPIVRIQHLVAWPGDYTGYKTSLMHFWEPRVALHVRLKRRCDELTLKEKEEHEGFEIAQKHCDDLVKHDATANDFYCRWKRSNIHPEGEVHAAAPKTPDHDQAIKDRLDMLENIKAEFDDAQRFFGTRNKADQLYYEGGHRVAPINYLELIRAYLSALAIREDKIEHGGPHCGVARLDFKADPKHNDEINALMLDKEHSGPGLFRKVAEMAHGMVDQRFFVAEKFR
jgi:hypothetical protein